MMIVTKVFTTFVCRSEVHITYPAYEFTSLFHFMNVSLNDRLENHFTTFAFSLLHFMLSGNVLTLLQRCCKRCLAFPMPQMSLLEVLSDLRLLFKTRVTNL